MSGYIPLSTVSAVATHDQAGREVITLYALDHSGRAWVLHEGYNWTLVGNPTVENAQASTPE